VIFIRSLIKKEVRVYSKWKFLTIVLQLFAWVVLPASTALSSGYQLNEHGSRAVAMGGAFVARAWDPSAIYYNPAGLGNIRGINIMLGGTLILPSTTFTGPYPNNTETKMNSVAFFPPNAYFSYNFENGLAVGIGVFTPEGLGTNWPTDWVGRFIITKINLQSFNINPTVSYSLGGMISLGVGFDYALGSVELEKYNSTQFVDSSSGEPITPFIHMQSNAHGAGYNFGILLKPYENISLGFSYRSKITYKASDGTATFSQAGSLSSLLPGGSVSTSLPFPTTWYAGVAYTTEKFSIEADYQYVGWSAYDSLMINFQKQTSVQQNTSIVGKYSNGYIVRIGGEYILNDVWALRAGVFYDKNPIPDAYDAPILPDADRLGLNIGIGINVTNNISVDASYMFLPFKQRTITNSAFGFNGTYNTTANLLGVDIGYRL
jgi:long-chain fatty acid transport protein